MSNSVNSLQIAKLDAAQPCHFAEQPKEIQGLIVTLLLEDRDYKNNETNAEKRMFAIAQVCKYTYALVYNQLIPGKAFVHWPNRVANIRASCACWTDFKSRQEINDSPLRFQYFSTLLKNGAIIDNIVGNLVDHQALVVAVDSRNPDNLRTCLQLFGSKLSLIKNYQLSEVFSIAIKNDDLEMVQMLRQDENLLPIYYAAFSAGIIKEAAYRGRLAIVQALLQHSADLDGARSMAIEIAARFGQSDTVLGLLKESSNPDADRLSAILTARHEHRPDVARAIFSNASWMFTAKHAALYLWSK